MLCVASFTPGVPRWRKGSGEGWVTASTRCCRAPPPPASDRESVKGRIGGRTHEISRLIGRSLRAVVDVSALGENTLVLDCDVLQADGGTRTAAITGAWVALADAVAWGQRQGAIKGAKPVLLDSVAAVSVGIVDGVPVLDLPYVEDVRAHTDMNVVVTGKGQFVEVQGTAEQAPFDRRELDALLDLALQGPPSSRAAGAGAGERHPGPAVTARRPVDGRGRGSSSPRTTRTRSPSSGAILAPVVPGSTRPPWSARGTSAPPSRSRTA